MQPISEERVLERATKASRVVQIIDNIGKDNEVKAKKEKREVQLEIAGLQFRGKRESECKIHSKREGYKSGRGMPGLQEARKDVASCAKARGSASRK